MTAPENIRERLAEAIWNASRADEGTISATGAGIVADALLPLIDTLLREQAEGIAAAIMEAKPVHWPVDAAYDDAARIARTFGGER
jgi:hypothetical protein